MPSLSQQQQQFISTITSIFLHFTIHHPFLQSSGIHQISRVNLWCALKPQTSPWSVHCVTNVGQKTAKIDRLVGWEINVPSQRIKRLYQGQGLGWRYSSSRLRMANDTVTSRPHCLFVQRWPRMGKDTGGSFSYYASAYNRVDTTNHHKTYLSVKCDILCNCCSSVPITYQCLTTLVA